MEDYTYVPEEERGVGEPYTYQDSVITCTYEFREGVKPLTQRGLQYLIAVQDSTLFFSDNIPSELLPARGGYLCAGCSRTLPFGLCHRVTDVEHKDGMTVLTLAHATNDEVFKDLHVVMNLKDYQMPAIPASLDTTSTATRAVLEANPHLQLISDSAYFDFSFVDAAQVTPMTRADQEESKDHEQGHTVSDPKVSEWTFEFDLTKAAETVPKLKKLGVTPKLSITIKKTSTFDTYYEEWKSKEFRKQVDKTETKTENTLGFSLSKDLIPEKMTPKTYTLANGVFYAIQAAQKASANLLVQKKQDGMPPIYIGFPSGIPFCLRIVVGLGFELNLGIAGSLTITNEQDVWEVTTITDHDKDIPPSRKRVKKGSVKASGCIYGEGYAQIAPKAALGVMLGDALSGSGVGLEAAVGYKVKAGLKLIPQSLSGGDEDVSGTNFYFTHGPFFQINVYSDILRHNWFNLDITPESWKPKDNTTYFPIFPQIDSKNTYHTCEYEYDQQMRATIHHAYQLCFNHGYFLDSYNRDAMPRLRVYKAKDKELGDLLTELKPYRYKYKKIGLPYPDEGIMITDAVYYFKYDSKEDDEIYMVPCLKDKENSKVSEFRVDKIPFGIGSMAPVVEMVKCRELSSAPSGNGSDDVYEYATIVKLANTARVSELGYYLTIDVGNGTLLCKDLKYTAKRAEGQALKGGTYKITNKIYIPSKYREVQGRTPYMTIRPYVLHVENETELEKKAEKDGWVTLKYPCNGAIGFNDEVNFDVKL